MRPNVRIEEVQVVEAESYHKITIKIGKRSYTRDSIAPGENAQFQGVSIEPGEEISVSVEWVPQGDEHE